MAGITTFWGKAVSNQATFSEKHCRLYGESPVIGDVLSNQDLDGAVVFDGEIWRELDLAGMRAAAISGGMPAT